MWMRHLRDFVNLPKQVPKVTSLSRAMLVANFIVFSLRQAKQQQQQDVGEDNKAKQTPAVPAVQAAAAAVSTWLEGKRGKS